MKRKLANLVSIIFVIWVCLVGCETTATPKPKEPNINTPVVKKSNSIKVLIAGNIKNHYINFGGCPEILAVNIINMNGNKSFKSEDINLQDSAVYNILGNHVNTNSTEKINGFQVPTDENGYYYTWDEVNSDIEKISYKITSYNSLTDCQNGKANIKVYEVLIQSELGKAPEKGEIVKIYMPKLEITKDGRVFIVKGNMSGKSKDIEGKDPLWEEFIRKNNNLESDYDTYFMEKGVLETPKK